MLFRVLAVLVLCSCLAGGSLLAWRSRPAPAPRAAPALCLPSAPSAQPSVPTEDLPWVNPNVMPGLLRLEHQVMFERPVRELRASEDGSRIAALLTDGTLWLLRRDGSTLVRERVVARGVEGFDLSPSGSVLATTDEGHELTRWTLPVQGEPESRFITKDAWGPSLRDGQLRWTGPAETGYRLDEHGEAVLDAARTDETAAELDADALAGLSREYGEATSLAVVGGLVLGGTDDGRLMLADGAHGGSITVARVQRGGVTALLARAHFVLSGGEDGALRLWSVNSVHAPSARRVPTDGARGDEGPANVYWAWDDAATGRRAVRYGDPMVTRVFTADRPEGIRAPGEEWAAFLPGSVAFSNESNRLVIRTDRGAHEATVDLRPCGSVNDIETGGGGRQLLVRGSERTLLVDRTTPRAPTVRVIAEAARYVEASPSGAWFGLATRDHVVRVWRPGHEESARAHSFRAVNELEFDAADSVVIVGADDEAHAWHLASDRVVSLAMPAGGRLTDVRASRDGAHALGAFSDGATVLWDTHSGRVVQRFCCQEQSADYTELSPDGALVLAHAYAGELSVWSVATGAEIARWTPPEGLQQYPGFSPDGSAVRWYTHDARVTWPLRSLVTPPR